MGPAIDLKGAVGFVEILDLHHRLSAPLRNRELKLYFFSFCGEFNTFYFLEHLDPALNLPGLGILVPKSLDEPLGLFNFPLLRFGSGLRDFPAIFLLYQVVVIVPVIQINGLGLNLSDPLNQMIEKHTVMGDNDHGSWIIGQEIFQPNQGVKVEVIGGLIEKEQVRCLKKDLGEGDSRHPAPAQLVCGPSEITLLES